LVRRRLLKKTGAKHQTVGGRGGKKSLRHKHPEHDKSKTNKKKGEPKGKKNTGGDLEQGKEGKFQFRGTEGAFNIVYKWGGGGNAGGEENWQEEKLCKQCNQKKQVPHFALTDGRKKETQFTKRRRREGKKD